MSQNIHVLQTYMITEVTNTAAIKISSLSWDRVDHLCRQHARVINNHSDILCAAATSTARGQIPIGIKLNPPKFKHRSYARSQIAWRLSTEYHLTFWKRWTNGTPYTILPSTVMYQRFVFAPPVLTRRRIYGSHTTLTINNQHLLLQNQLNGQTVKPTRIITYLLHVSAFHPPNLAPRLKKEQSYTSTPPMYLHGML